MSLPKTRCSADLKKRRFACFARDEKGFSERREYVHLNPVKKGLGNRGSGLGIRVSRFGIRSSRIGVSSPLSPCHPLLRITEN